MNGWKICMQTMLKAVRTLCSNTYALTRGLRSLPKGSLTWECSAPALTCLSLDAGVEMEAAQAQEGPKGGKLVRRGNAHFKGQEGKMVWWRVEDGEGKRKGRGEEGFCVVSSRGTWDTLHMSTSVMECPPHSQSNVNLISSGLKEANNNLNYSSSFYSHQRRRETEMKTSFREL